jgi:protein ImuB
MRLLHLYWPHLPLDLARARSDSFPSGPVIVGGQPWTDGTVIDADPLARALGVRRGIPLGSAHRLAPEATFVDPDPETDRETVEAAFEALAAFSPGLAGVSDPADPAFGLLIVQADGLERLWGSEERLVERLTAALESILPGPPRAGIAGTRFAATIAAGRARPCQPVIVPPGGEASFLGPLPTGLLSPDPDVRARLARFGLKEIGAVAALPRSALVARFGPEGERIHARARGEEIVRFEPRRTPERMALALPIEPPVTDLEPLRFVLHRLTGTLADQLLARGTAAATARLRLGLDLAFAPLGTPESLTVEQRLPEQTADAEAIERLLFARLERTPPAAAVARLELELGGVSPAAGQQLSLFVPQAARNSRLAWQLARLALTYGDDRVRRVTLGDPEAPLAERRWGWQAIVAEGRIQ